MTGSDYEACTVTFGLNVLCEDMVSLTGRGDLHVSWTFQWPSAPGSTGPTAWDGVVDGGTGSFSCLPPGGAAVAKWAVCLK